MRSTEQGVISVASVIKKLGEPLKGLTREQLELVISSGKLNVAQASLLLRGAGVERQDRKQILQKLGLTAATAGQTAATNGLTLSLSQLTKILWAQVAAWAATPFGMATIAAAGIFGLVKLVDWMTVSVEESREALAELGQEFKENESKITELNGELETTVDRIAELEGKDSLTFTEAEELQNLKKQNNELEREIAILETIQRIKSQERNAAFVETMEKDLTNAKEYLRSHDYSSSNYSVVYGDTKKYGKGRSVRTMSEMDLINSALMRRAEIIETLSGNLTEEERTKLESLQYEIDNYLTEKLTELNNDVDSSGVSYISNPTTEDEKAVNEWLSFIDDFNDKMMIAMGTIGAKENAVNRLILGDYAEVTKDLQELGKQGAVTADHLADPKYDNFINKCIELGIISDDGADSLSFLALAFNTVSDAADGASSSTQNVTEQLQTEIDTINDGIDGVQAKLSTLSDALTKLQDGSLGVNEVIDLLQQFPELAPYVDLTAEGFGNLEQGLRDLIKASPDKLIESLQKFKETKDLTEEQKKQIDGLCDSLSNLATDSVQNLSGEFGILADQINAATKAQTELEKKLAEDDYDEGYEGRVSAYEGLQETIKAGEFGSKAYAAYKNYFGLEDMDSSGVKKWMEDNKKYFTEGTDGILEFMKTVERLGEADASFKEVATFDSSTGAFWYDINRLSEFAKELGWTEEMLQDFIYKYRMYCEEWTSRSAQDNLTEFSNAGLVFDVGDETFASLDKLTQYTGLSKDSVLELVSAMNELREQQGLDPIQVIGSDQITITQATIDNLLTAGATAEDVKALLLELAGQDNVTIEAGIELDGQSVEQMIADATGDGTESVSIDITMSVNDEEVIATVTTTAEQMRAILGEDWETKISADSADAEERIGAVNTLLTGLPEDTLVTVSDSTVGVRSNLSSVKNYLQYISNNANKTITITYRQNGSPISMNASGTRHATRGPSLLGDEYSPDGSPKPELVVSKGRAYLAGQNGPEIGYLNEGDIVYNAAETKRILRGNTLHSSIQAHAGGTANGLIDNGGLSGGDYNFSGKPSGNNHSNSNNDDDEESWFERQYKDHQHWLAMDQESVDEYLKWLDEAYQKAYEEGIIDLDEYYKYQEEVYHGLQDLFKDYLNDIDHEISMLEGAVGSSDEVIALAEQAMSDIEDELAAARAAGLDENSEYIQYLEQQWKGYSDTVTDLREQAETEAKNSVDDLVDYRVEMLKQEIEDEKEALNKKLKALQEFYDEQRKMLQDQYDEEKYLEEQKEKRKAVSDIDAELAMLEHDDSAWAQKRKLELQEERANADKELSNFERDHALDVTLDMLDEQQAAQEAQIQAEMDALDERLNDPHALFNQALNDIKNNTAELYQEFIEYNRKHGTGNDEDIEEMWEEAYIADQEYKDTHDGESQDGIEIGNYTGYVPPETPQPPAQTEPTEPQTPTTTTPTEEETKPSLAKGSSIQVKKSATHFSSKSGGVRMASFVPGGTYTVYQTSGNEVLIGRKGVYTGWIKKSDIVGYASGTSNASAGLHGVDEIGTEYIFESADGSRYRMFHGGEKVLTAEATNFLYNFANTGGSVLAKMIADLFKSSGLGNVSKPIQAIEVHSGDIIVQGNATAKTVSEIRRAQRENLEFVLKELNKLNK